MRSLLFLLLILPLCLAAQQTKRVLFIGNSYIYTSDMPGQLNTIATSLGDTLIKDQNTIGGYTFEGHSTNTITLQKISLGGWDYVVLQEQSQLPSFGDGQVAVQVYPFADSLCRKIREADSCTTPLFFMTWGRENGDASNCAGFPPLCTYAGMQYRLRNAYVNMANMNDAEVSPVGMVWSMIRDSFPLIDLYIADESHPTLTGSYATACTFYAAMYHKSPVGAAYPNGVSAADAANIQQVAAFVVFDSLNIWRIDTTTLAANFTASTDTLRNASFSNNTGSADSYFWDFGDGGTSSLENPTHTYAADTTVTISLTATRGCETSTSMQSLTVLLDTTISTPIDTTTDTTGTAAFIVNIETVQLYPNPASNSVSINLPTIQPYNYQLYNLAGQAIVKGQAIGSTQIDLSDVPDGVYILSADIQGQVIRKKLVVLRQ